MEYNILMVRADNLRENSQIMEILKVETEVKDIRKA